MHMPATTDDAQSEWHRGINDAHAFVSYTRTLVAVSLRQGTVRNHPA
jgi:hypothetical protein